ncbi:MAG: hypothetical protein AB7S72_08190 [Draconibacterium sp.]
MKQFTAVILVISLFSFQFSEGLIYLSFKINQNYIAKNLCVEKDVEGSTCKGCCQLKKRLDENQQKKEQLPPQISGKNDINLFVNQIFSCCTSDTPQKINFRNYNSHYWFCLPHEVFHPPKVLI